MLDTMQKTINKQNITIKRRKTRIDKLQSQLNITDHSSSSKSSKSDNE
jgi:hypothetical protein